VNSQPPAAPVDRSRLLARDYWLVLSRPTAGTGHRDLWVAL